MKKIIIIIAVVLFPFMASAQIKKASLQASGLTCSMCSNSVLKSLTAVPFVDKIDSDVETSTFNITFKEGQEVDLDALQKAVSKAGFSVSKLVFTMNVGAIKVKEDAHIDINGKTYHFINVKEKALNGDVDLTLIDKNFVTSKEFKKFKSQTKMACYTTGTKQACCSSGTSNDRMYHVTI
ncbi:Heavy-metal-associated domain protein [compost metagenome]